MEWSNKSLCIPKKIYSTSALLALDVPSHLETANVDDIIDKISDVVCRWNAFHQYDRNKNNCQVFIEELLLCLGISPDLFYKGQLGDSLKKMKSKGECDIKFKLDHDLQELLGIKEKKMSFKSHQELDKFIAKLEETHLKVHNKLYSDKYPHDFALLKSIDRAFWLRYYREKNNEEFCPLKDGSKIVCPCGDPISTKSFASQDWF